MTQQEFFERTMVKVSNDEFLAIVTVYNNSDLGKDEFCKMWCKMNKSRVTAAKVDHKWAQKEAAYKDALAKWYNKWIGKTEHHYTLVAYTGISVFEVRALAHADIRIGSAEVVSDLLYKVGKYLGYHE